MNETLLNTMFAGIQNNSLHQDLYILRDNLSEIKECVYFYKTKISKEKTGIEKTNIILAFKEVQNNADFSRNKQLVHLNSAES